MIIGEKQKQALLSYAKDFQEDYKKFDEKRVFSIKELKSLVEDFIYKKITLKEFKERSGSACRKFPYWGFKGFSGQMQLNQYVKNIDDKQKENVLREALIVPGNEHEVVEKINNLSDYIIKLRKKLNHPRGFPWPSQIFMLTYFWEIQIPEKWPIYYDASKKVLSSIGFDFSASNSHGRKYLEFVEVINAIKKFYEEEDLIDKKHPTWFIEHVLWRQHQNQQLTSGLLKSEEKKKEQKIKRTEKGELIQEIKGIGEDIFEATEQEQPLAIPQKEKRVVWQPKDYSIRELFEMFKDGELHLQPKFQRLHVWDKKKAYRLIESIFLDVPIPVIYLAEEENGVFTIIDGQQRLTSFFDFMDGRLKIKGLLVLTELNGKKFAELFAEQKSKFKKATIHTIVIKKESQEDIRFEIFERLNTGSVQLNDQELRNCMFRGEYNELLEDLAKDKTFLNLLGLKESHKRMMDRELILRFFTFYHSTYLRYEPPMKAFLNNEMRNFVSLDEKEAEKLRKLFKKSVDLTETVFGEKSFRRFISGSETDPNGLWKRKKINKALFDIVMYGFTDYEKHQIVPRSDAIREELIWLMTHDQSFIDSIMFGTSDKSKVLTRFEKWLKNLREIVGYPQKEPRAFSLELKAELHRNNPTCRICGQRIQVLDDSEVDHIDFYWRGGKTTPSNARLVHRYCNRQRGGRD